MRLVFVEFKTLIDHGFMAIVFVCSFELKTACEQCNTRT